MTGKSSSPCMRISTPAKPLQAAKPGSQAEKDHFPQCERVTYYTVCDSSGRPIRAYGLSQVITAQQLEKRKYKQFVQDLFTANPLAVALIPSEPHTRNEILESHTPIEHYRKTEAGSPQKAHRRRSFDKVICDMPSEDERAQVHDDIQPEDIAGRFPRRQDHVQLRIPAREFPNGMFRWSLMHCPRSSRTRKAAIRNALSTTDITDTKARRGRHSARDETRIRFHCDPRCEHTFCSTFRNIRSDDDIPKP